MQMITTFKTEPKKITIQEIETLTENDAFDAAIDTAEIKGHTIYFVDFGGRFGYSVLVFKDGQHIRYANDYELHHSGKTREELNALYKRALSMKLFTDDEIAEPLKSYDDYKAKEYYLRNYYGLRRKNVSIFCINPTEEQQAEFERKTKTMVFDPVALAYYDDKDFVNRHVELMNALSEQYDDTANNYEYQKSVFLCELGNHEYHINSYQGDWDTLSAFGNITWKGQGKEARQQYYAELNFTETQIKAFEDARKEFLKMAMENDWY